MKYFMQYLAVVCMLISMAACNELDNYDAPSKKFSGRIVYNGEPINVEKGQVRLQLWESGWELKKSIDLVIQPDGSFETLLFNGDYKIFIPKNDGPFMTKINDQTQSDTIPLTLRGNAELDIEVLPYYIPKSATFNVSGSKLSTAVSIEKIITDENAKDIEYVRLFINKGQFVSNSNNIKNVSVNGGDIADLNNIALELDIPAIVPAQQYVYARVGIKVAGREDMIFSSVQKVDF